MFGCNRFSVNVHCLNSFFFMLFSLNFCWHIPSSIMAVFSDFVDVFQSPWGTLRLVDWKAIFLSCTIFTAGCVLAAMSWKLGASSLFVLLYISLGTTGFLLSNFRVFKGKSRREPETLPLFSASLVEVPEYQQDEKPFDVVLSKTQNTESFPRSNEKSNWNYGTGCNYYSVDASTKNDLPVHSTHVQKYTGDANRNIKCVDISYHPRLAHEQYATGPTPGGSQSRRQKADGQSGSWQGLLPVADVFGTRPRTEPSAQFHVPLESSDDQQETESANPEENQLVPQFMSSVPHQPIYQNIIPYPERRRIFSESVLIKLLDYDTPSHELRPVVCQDEVSPFGGQGPSSSEPRRTDSISRLGGFTSPERTYVNSVRTYKQEHIGEERPAETLRGFGTESKILNSVMNPLTQTRAEDIYANIPAKMEQAEVLSPVTQLDRHSPCKTSAFLSSKDTGVRLSPKNRHLDKEYSSETNRSIQAIQSHHSLLKEENIYVNVASLRQNPENQPNETGLSRNNLSKTDKTSNSEAETALKPENIYMNFPPPLNPNKSTTLSDTVLCEIQEESGSEGGYWADVETDISNYEQYIIVDKNTSQIQPWAGRKVVDKARSDHMYVSPLGITLTNKKSCSSGIPNFQPELDNDLTMKLADSVGDLDNYETSPPRIRQYENPLYGASIANQYLELNDKEDNFIGIKEEDKKSDDKNPSMCRNDHTGIKKSNSSRKSESSMNITYLIDPNTSGTCRDQLVKNLRSIQTTSEVPENQGPSKEFKDLTSPKYEDSFCSLERLTGCKGAESGNTKIVNSERSTFCEDSISPSKHSRSFQKTETVKSKDPEVTFSPEKQLTVEATSTTSADRHSRRRASFNTPVEVPRLKSFLSPELRTTPLILPPLNKGYSSPTIRSSPGNPTSPEKIDIPVILNNSSIVQTQLQKLSAMSRDSAQSVSRPCLLSARQSSSKTPSPKSQNLQSRIASLSLGSTTQSPERDRYLTSPSELSTRTFEQLSKTSSSAVITSRRESDTVTHSECTSSTKTSGESSSEMPKHPPL